MQHIIGRGVLSWYTYERREDRYGAVTLSATPLAEKAFPLDTTHAGTYGQLVAVVEEIRASHHVGDLHHKIYPVTPKLGDRIILGKGILFFGEQDLYTEENCVGLRPTEGRSTLWLDIKNLYRAHDQTVMLTFEPLPPPSKS